MRTESKRTEKMTSLPGFLIVEMFRSQLTKIMPLIIDVESYLILSQQYFLT